MRLSTGEILMILMIALLVFGASRLPDLGKGLGQGMRSFRDALKGLDESNSAETADKTPPAGETKPGDKPPGEGTKPS